MRIQGIYRTPERELVRVDPHPCGSHYHVELTYADGRKEAATVNQVVQWATSEPWKFIRRTPLATTAQAQS